MANRSVSAPDRRQFPLMPAASRTSRSPRPSCHALGQEPFREGSCSAGELIASPEEALTVFDTATSATSFLCVIEDDPAGGTRVATWQGNSRQHPNTEVLLEVINRIANPMDLAVRR